VYVSTVKKVIDVAPIRRERRAVVVYEYCASSASPERSCRLRQIHPSGTRAPLCEQWQHSQIQREGDVCRKIRYEERGAAAAPLQRLQPASSEWLIPKSIDHRCRWRF
jgi:hypothetical protein